MPIPGWTLPGVLTAGGAQNLMKGYGVLPGQGTTTNTDMLLTNTTKGYSWNVVARVDKRWDSGFRLGGSYTFQRARDLNPGTSSVAFSNYTNAAAGIDPNNAAYGISNYQRDDAWSLAAHRRVFDGFAGPKHEMVDDHGLDDWIRHPFA